jgi:hypothetical protein
MGCSQEMGRKKQKEIWNGFGCPRAFLIRKATKGTKLWWFSLCCSTDMDCTCSRIRRYHNLQHGIAIGNSEPSSLNSLTCVTTPLRR